MSLQIAEDAMGVESEGKQPTPYSVAVLVALNRFKPMYEGTAKWVPGKRKRRKAARAARRLNRG